MVVFVDLDDSDEEVEHQHQHQQQYSHSTPFDMRDLMNVHATRSSHHSLEKGIDSEEEEEEEDTDQDHPNLNALSAVLGNYPFVHLL